MLQKILIRETRHYDLILLPCPHCGVSNELDVEDVFVAYRDNTRIICVACKDIFYVDLFGQTRAAELPLEPTAPI